MIRPLMAAAGISRLAACTQRPAERIVEAAQSPSVEVVAPQQEPQPQPVVRASEKPDYSLPYAEMDDGEFR